MGFSELSPSERTACFKLLGVVLGRLPYAIPDATSPERKAVDLLLLELENELSASRPHGEHQLGTSHGEPNRGRPHEVVPECGPFAWLLSALGRRGHGR